MRAHPRPTHFEVRAASGQVVHMESDTRIHQNTTIQWVIRAVSRATKWPLSYIRIMVGQAVYQYSHRLPKMNDLTLWNVIDHMHEAGAGELPEETLVIYGHLMHLMTPH